MLQRSATAGTTFSSIGSHRVKPSKSWRATRTEPGSPIRIGSSVDGSLVAILKTSSSAPKSPGVSVPRTVEGSVSFGLGDGEPGATVPELSLVHAADKTANATKTGTRRPNLIGDIPIAWALTAGG